MMPTFEPAVLVDDRCTERLNWYSKFEKVLPDGTKLFTESQLQQAYEAGKRDAVPEWMPIETAPKDGVWIICKSFRRLRTETTTEVKFNGLSWVTEDGSRVSEPTHWFPRPAAPKGEKE